MLRPLRQQDDGKVVVRYISREEWLMYIDGEDIPPPTGFSEKYFLKMLEEKESLFPVNRQAYHRVVFSTHISED